MRYLMLFALLLGATYQDKTLTPGDADTTLIAAQVCVPGFSKSRRKVTIAMKREIFRRYGVKYEPAKYEVDHLISLELGGTNALRNLWPQAYEPRPGAHEKDIVENWLHRQVCSGKMSLEEAQWRIANDWLEVWNYINPAIAAQR